MCHICVVYFSSTLIPDFINFAVSKGADPDTLNKRFPYRREQKHIGYDLVVELLNFVGKELDDDCLGLHMGEQMSLKTTAYVDSIMQHSETLENSFKNAVYYSKIISDALDCKLEKNQNEYAVIFEENPNWKVHQTHAKRQILDLTLLSCLNSLIAYTGKNYYPKKVSFHTEKPKNINEYYRLFNCGLKFNCERTEILFEKQIFDKHSKQIHFGLLKNLKEKVNQEIKVLDSENELIYELKKAILNHKPERILIKDAAEKLNSSKRTLQRKLSALNTSFKEIEYELQLRLSRTYLEEKQKSIDEISYLLGFSESSAFIRFFKSLVKMTPTEYRKHCKSIN